jgi:hypothetical protein
MFGESIFPIQQFKIGSLKHSFGPIQIFGLIG